jgi:alanine dehydrogenase
VLFLSAAEVGSLLDLDALADAVQAAMADLSAGRASVPPRVAALVPGDAMLAAMPAYLPGAGAPGPQWLPGCSPAPAPAAPR